MNNIIDLNENLASCTQDKINIGSTTHYNICNGKTVTVPWGSGDWVAILLIGTVLLGFLGILFVMFWDLR